MIVVGAGIIGLACAWRLSQRGHRVTVFDAGGVGCEASWAGAGMLAPGGEVEEESPLARMALASLEQYPAFVAELCETSGIAIDHQHCGAMEVAFTTAEADALEYKAALQSVMGIRSEPATYKGSVSARFFPDEQLVDPRQLIAALQLTCLRMGVQIHTNEPVSRILPDGSGVITSAGEYRDEGVLVAAGAWSSALCPDLPVTMPVRGHLVSYDMRQKLIGSILRHNGTYLLQRSNGLLIAGSSTEHVGFDRSIDEKVVNDIHTRASRLLPVLQALAPDARWNGFRPGVAGGRPVIGKIERASIWTAFGHYRNGILLAPQTARMIVELTS